MNANFAPNDTTAPWEGIGTGWFYSALGSGLELRPYSVAGSKQEKIELGKDGDWTKTNITTNRLPIGLINIDKLEEITGYDFLSNLLAEIQEAIEGRKYPDIIEEIYNKEIKIRPRSASLMASTPEAGSIYGSLFDSPIGHNSIPNQIAMATDIISGDIDILEVSINQNSMGKTKTRQLTTSEIGTSSIHVIQNGISQISFNQTTPEQVSRIQLGFSEDSTFQTRSLQNGSSK